MINFEIPEELKKSNLMLYIKKSDGIYEFLLENGYKLNSSQLRLSADICYYCIIYVKKSTENIMTINTNPNTTRIHESDVIVVTDQVLRLMRNTTEQLYKALRKQNEILM